MPRPLLKACGVKLLKDFNVAMNKADFRNNLKIQLLKVAFDLSICISFFQGISFIM